ncbi:MAG TPA: hypothetical protein VMN36_01200 [Verrucomicrobiales bacterium]|nr:hypothetical protein [Verrucomicrobiales bacterium]
MATSPMSSRIVDRIDLAAYKLAVYFMEDTDLPARYRQLKDPSRRIGKVKEDSDMEKRLKINVRSSRQLIDTMLAKVDENQAWRLINLSPQFKNAINSVTENKDFSDFVDYFILRRDKERCGPDELGGLALLSVASQREVEKRIQA